MRHDHKTVKLTFVREPLEHFVSAYSEVQYRTGSRAKEPETRRPLSSTKEDLKKFLKTKTIVVEPTRNSSVFKSSDWSRTHRAEKSGSERRALAFIRDFIAGNLHHVSNLVDLHVFPQVGFVDPRAFPLDFIGNLTNSVEDSHLMKVRSQTFTPSHTHRTFN